jgi:aryl-alcohol dehydrogenase-like predicted oxidoreductase
MTDFSFSLKEKLRGAQVGFNSRRLHQVSTAASGSRGSLLLFKALLTAGSAVLDFAQRLERMMPSSLNLQPLENAMKTRHLSRRQFLGRSTAAAALLLAPGSWLRAAAAVKRTAVDQVMLGKTGIKLSRLGFGAGSDSGNIQRALGQEAFNKLIRYAYDQGITYFDCAQSYRTFEWMAGAIKGLPREKLFLQSKIGGQPEQILEAIDHHRKVYDTDYIDSLLIHCMVKDGWTDQWKRIMDAFDEAKEKKWIRAKGVSCHSLPALRAATASDWTEVHLVRVNPQAKHIDGMEETWNKPGTDLAPVLTEIKAMRAKGRGIIGMKIIGNGDFTQPEDREKSIRYAMSRPELDAVVIGFKSAAEIDEAIRRMNQALAETG